MLKLRLLFFSTPARHDRALMSSIQVFVGTVYFVDFTLYYNGYNDFIGKNLLLCPNNMNFLKNKLIQLEKYIIWFNFFFLKLLF
jgi:hypothetical protein